MNPYQNDVKSEISDLSAMPVPPTGVYPWALPSLKAGPAISRWSHGLDTNSFKNNPATSIPPIRSPIFAISATGESSEGLSSSGSGMGQNCSPESLAAIRN